MILRQRDVRRDEQGDAWRAAIGGQTLRMPRIAHDGLCRNAGARSRDAAVARDAILAAVREHSPVENALHWVLDVQLGEDACAIGEARGARNVATLRRIVLLLLSRETTRKRGIAAKQAKAARNTDYLERVLAGAITGV